MKTLNFVVVLAIVLLCACSAYASVSDNLVVNSNFNDGSGGLTIGQWSNYASLPGWTSTGGAGIEVQFETVAKGTGKYVELDTTKNSNMQQTINGLNAGSQYTLTFDYYNRRNDPVNTSDIEVYMGDKLLLKTDWYAQAWTTFSKTFTYSSDYSNVLTFLAVGKSDSYGGFVDNVSMQPVPIPGAALLLGSAILGLVGIRRRQLV